MNVYYKSKFTGIEIDQRLAQGTYDDAVKAGFTGTKEEFDQLTWAFGKEQQELLKTAQQQRADNLETESKNVVEAINEINTKTVNSVNQDQLKSEVSKLNQTIATVNSNLVTSIGVLNQNIADGFNTINGGINNEIRPAIKANNDAIIKEISDREQENKNIRSEFTEEDSKLQNTINSIKTELQESINTESSERKSADTVLSNRIATIEDAGYQTGTEVDNRINEIVGAAPEALDTLKEIADALNNDPDFAATITNELSKKVDKVDGKQLSTEDYTTAEKEKLAGLENYDDSNILNQLQQTETGVANNITEIEKLQSGKQDTLVSGENIKTIDGESLLGQGDVKIRYPMAGYGSTNFPDLCIKFNNQGQLAYGETIDTFNQKLYKGVNWILYGIHYYLISSISWSDHYYWIYAVNVNNPNKALDIAFNGVTNPLVNPRDTKLFQLTEDETLTTTSKTIPGAINELKSSTDSITSKVPIYTVVPTLTGNYLIPVNSTTQEKVYQIAIGSTVYGVYGADGIIWQNGIDPVVEANCTIVVSVINNLAVWGKFKNE